MFGIITNSALVVSVGKLLDQILEPVDNTTYGSTVTGYGSTVFSGVFGCCFDAAKYWIFVRFIGLVTWPLEFPMLLVSDYVLSDRFDSDDLDTDGVNLGRQDSNTRRNKISTEDSDSTDD